VCDDAPHVLDRLGGVDQEVIELLDEQVDARLHLRAVHRPALHQRRHEGAEHVPLPLGLLERHGQDPADEVGREVPRVKLLDALRGVPPALAHKVLLRDVHRVHPHGLGGEGGAAPLGRLALHRLLEGGGDKVLEGKPVSEGAEALRGRRHVEAQVWQASDGAPHALCQLHVVHHPRLLELLEQGEGHPHLLLPPLDGAVDGALDDLVPKVWDAELPHAPHRLLELPLHVVLLHKRPHALLELLHAPPRPHPPHVHDPRRAPVLLNKALDKRSNLLAPPRLHNPLRHKRHKHRRKHVVRNRTRNEVRKHRTHVGRVKRKVLNPPQRPDKPLKKLLAPVHPRQPRQEHARHLPLGVLLLQGHDEDALDNLVAVPRLLEVRELLDGATHLPPNEVLAHNLPHRGLELGDGERQLQLCRHLGDDFLAQLVASKGGDVLEKRLGHHLVFQKGRNSVRGPVRGVGRRLLRLLRLLQGGLEPGLDVGGLQGSPHDQGGEELGPLVPLLFGPHHRGHEHALHEFGPVLGVSHLVHAHGGIRAALAPGRDASAGRKGGEGAKGTLVRLT